MLAHAEQEWIGRACFSIVVPLCAENVDSQCVTYVQVLAVGEDLATALIVTEEDLTFGCFPAERSVCEELLVERKKQCFLLVVMTAGYLRDRIPIKCTWVLKPILFAPSYGPSFRPLPIHLLFCHPSLVLPLLTSCFCHLSSVASDIWQKFPSSPWLNSSPSFFNLSWKGLFPPVCSFLWLHLV